MGQTFAVASWGRWTQAVSWSPIGIAAFVLLYTFGQSVVTSLAAAIALLIGSAPAALQMTRPAGMGSGAQVEPTA